MTQLNNPVDDFLLRHVELIIIIIIIELLFKLCRMYSLYSIDKCLAWRLPTFSAALRC